MADTARQMPEHVGAAYKDAADNIRFLKRQQWLATNYALLVYVAIFFISAHYFSRTDFARNLLGLLTIATFGVHWYMMNLFERAITKFRNRLGWIYKTYFSGEERIGLGLELEPRHQPEVFISLLAVSLIGAVLTAIYLWSVRWCWRVSAGRDQAVGPLASPPGGRVSPLRSAAWLRASNNPTQAP
jgi:hypothetical protein